MTNHWADSTINNCSSDLPNQPFWQHSLIHRHNQNIHRMILRSVKGHETKLDERSLLERPWPEQRLLHSPNGSFLQQTLSAWGGRQSPPTVCGTPSGLWPGSKQHKQQVVMKHVPFSLIHWKLVVLGQLAFPPPTPMPQLLSFSSLRVWQEGLSNSRSIPFTPSGPKALSLRFSSVSRTPAHTNASPRHLWQWHR